MAAQKAQQTVFLVGLLAHGMSMPAALSLQKVSGADTGRLNVVTCANFTFENSMDDSSGNDRYMASGADTAIGVFTPWTPSYVPGVVGQALHLDKPSDLIAENSNSWLKGPVIDSTWMGDQYFEISFYLAMVDQNYQNGQGFLSFKNTSEGGNDDWVHLLWKNTASLVQIQPKKKAYLLFGNSTTTEDNGNGQLVLGPDMYDESVWHTVKLWTTNACGTSTWYLDIDDVLYSQEEVGSICGRQLFFNRHCWNTVLGLRCATRLEFKIDELVIRSDSPTPAPTPSPPTVSAIADPHLVNMRGERFDIYQPGNFVLLQLPRGAEPASTLLQVEAGARVMGGPCYVYFQVVTISGAWTNQTEPLLFTADPQSKPSTFNSAQWMHFGPVSVKVIHWRNKAPDFVDFLDIYAKNVGLTGLTVGGLLGSDDHKELAPRPRQCSRERGVATSSSFAEARS